MHKFFIHTSEPSSPDDAQQRVEGPEALDKWLEFPFGGYGSVSLQDCFNIRLNNTITIGASHKGTIPSETWPWELKMAAGCKSVFHGPKP